MKLCLQFDTSQFRRNCNDLKNGTVVRREHIIPIVMHSDGSMLCIGLSSVKKTGLQLMERRMAINTGEYFPPEAVKKLETGAIVHFTAGK